MREIRFAIRGLRRTPAFTIVVLSTIALGIGVNAVMFAITSAVLLRPLSYPRADRLLWLTMSDASRGLANLNVSYTRLGYMQEQSRTMGNLGAFAPTSVSLRISGEPELVPSVIVTRDLLTVLGVSVTGRAFLPQEDLPGGQNVAIITDAFWHSRLGGRAEVVGRPIEIDGRSVVVVGILPPGFRFPFVQPEPQIWLPRVFEHPLFSSDRVRSGAAYLNVIARMTPTATIVTARAEIVGLARAYNAALPGNADATGYAIDAVSLQDALVGSVQVPLAILAAAAGLVLIIVCVNVASLLIARASSRQRDIAIRRALGASNRRLLHSTLTESLLLALTGGTLGVLISVGTALLLRFLPTGVLPRADEVAVDGRVVAFSLALSVLSALVFALSGAKRSSGRSVRDALQEGLRGSTSAAASLVRIGLVISEIAVACLLVSGAALLLKSLNKLTRVDPGFDSHHVLSFTVAVPAARYPGVPQQTRFYKELVEDLATIPNVESVGGTSYLPISGGTRLIFVCPQGTACQGIGKDPIAAVRHITPAYFSTMRIPVLRGRAFDAHDNAASQDVCIVSEKAASAFFPNQDPIGRTILQSRGNITTVVVGVVGAVKALGLNGQLLPEFYVPQEQSAVPVRSMAIVVRSEEGFQPLLLSIRSTVAKLDPDLPLSGVSSMDEVLATSVAQPSLTTTLTEIFAVLALGLATIGIYGLIAYSVTQRRQEIAVRMALGAMPTNILTLIARQGAQLLAGGLGLGLAGSLALGRLLRTTLFEISPHDFGAYASVTLVIVLVTLAACYIPARRAMRVDLVAGLRGD